jgi:WD40 repeat protein
MLFGRQSAADWIDMQIVSNYRTLVLSALPMVGKTSFLRHIGALQLKEATNVLVTLSAVPESPPALNTVLQSVIDQLVPQLVQAELIDQTAVPTLPQTASTLREIFGRVNQNLAEEQLLALYFDDLHQLVGGDMALIAGFLTSLMPLLDECPALRLIFAINQDALKQIRHPLIDGAPVFNLGTLTTDSSITMITAPTKGVLRFDYGVTKRIAEVCSHHPYYLSLYCHTLLNRQVHDGWVNQQDFDNALSEILDSSIEPFTHIWEESTWAERAVLSGMAAIQGAHGPITGQEIVRYLQRQSPNVDESAIKHSLKTLAERGALIPMGAVSYRFHVEMLRFWLREHTIPAEIIQQVNWGKVAADIKPANKPSVRPAPHKPATRAKGKQRGWLLPAALILLLLCGALLVGGALAAQMAGVPLAFWAAPTPTATPTATPQSDDVAPLTGAEQDATPTPLAEPTAVPSPTPALVVARTLPSITFMGRDVDQNWRVYVMDADGSNQTALTAQNEADDASPVWSPDGRKIAFVSRRDGNREIYVMDADGQNVANVTRHPADDWTPAWSPDGTRLAFSSFRDGAWEIYALNTACLSEPASCPDSLTQITGDGNGNLSPVYSPDGTRITFSSKINGNWDIFTMAANGTDIRQVTVSPDNDLAPIWSPDGTRLAFESNRDGNVELYVIGANGGAAQNISNESQANDHGPVWSPDGQQLVFYSNREGNWDIFTIPLDGGPAVNLTNSPGRDEQTPAWRP